MYELLLQLSQASTEDPRSFVYELLLPLSQASTEDPRSFVYELLLQLAEASTEDPRSFVYERLQLAEASTQGSSPVCAPVLPPINRGQYSRFAAL